MHVSQAKTINSDVQKGYIFSPEGREDDCAFTEAERSFAIFHPCYLIQESVAVPILQVKKLTRNSLQTQCSLFQ